MTIALPKPSEAIAIAMGAYVGPWRWNVNGVRVIDTTLGSWRAVGFEGTTKDGWQILRDIRFLPWWSRYGGFGPAGFVLGAQDVVEGVVAETIDDARVGRLFLAGHSLGAALALRLAAHYAVLGYPVPVFAYEPPRSGLWRLRRVLAPSYVFICHNGDSPVPGVPMLYLQPAKVTAIGHRDRWLWQRVLRIGGNIGDHRIVEIKKSLIAAGL